MAIDSQNNMIFNYPLSALNVEGDFGNYFVPSYFSYPKETVVYE